MPDGFRRCSRSRSPDDDAAAEAQPPRPDLADSCIAPEVEERRLGDTCVEVANAAAEERPDLSPTRSRSRTGGGQADPDVELPERAPDAARHGEFEHCNHAAGTYDARELRHRGVRVVDVPQE